MTRSYKKRPSGWLCSSNHGDMKKWKSQQNRKVRRIDPLEEIPKGSTYKRKSDIWDSPSDGKVDRSRFWDDPKKGYRK